MATKKQPTGKSARKSLLAVHRNSVDLLCSIARDEYGREHMLLDKLLHDVAALYEGRWPTHEACEAPYHNFDHSLDVALAVARMAAGWNRAPEKPAFPENLFLCGIAAGLFHDAGYIKDKGDHDGRGGKFTFTHVQRGMKMAAEYLREAEWPSPAATVVPRLIAMTDYKQKIDPTRLFADDLELSMGRIVPTADLVAQMADIRYLSRLKDLFAEFKEVYEHEGTEKLAAQGTPVYKSAKEIKNGVIDFYEEFVTPRLREFGRMDRYLSLFFDAGRNPYHENIAANLSSQLMHLDGHWRRLGDILKELGVVSAEQIAEALARQRKLQRKTPSANCFSETITDCLLPWMDKHVSGNCLGDVLMDMNAIEPKTLARGLLLQMLPDALTHDLSRQELLFLVRASMLLHNIIKGPWIVGQVLETANDMLGCEASSILLAKPGAEEMLISLPTGPRKKALQGLAVSMDKGLAGWVYRNCKPALVANVLSDDRFDTAVDRHFDFQTRSLLAVPLHINGSCFGVLEAINKSDDNFNEHDMHILITLANMMASAFIGIIGHQAA